LWEVIENFSCTFDSIGKKMAGNSAEASQFLAIAIMVCQSLSTNPFLSFLWAGAALT
jgi:hypothetical protein